jgi:hypothetical protein
MDLGEVEKAEGPGLASGLGSESLHLGGSADPEARKVERLCAHRPFLGIAEEYDGAKGLKRLTVLRGETLVHNGGFMAPFGFEFGTKSPKGFSYRLGDVRLDFLAGPLRRAKQRRRPFAATELCGNDPWEENLQNNLGRGYEGQRYECERHQPKGDSADSTLWGRPGWNGRGWRGRGFLHPAF